MAKTTVRPGNPYAGEGGRMPSTTGMVAFLQYFHHAGKGGNMPSTTWKRSGGNRGNNSPASSGNTAPEESRVSFHENACSCTDSLGNGKRLYATCEDAGKALETSEEARNVSLSIYKCPEGGGWHLTHL